MASTSIAQVVEDLTDVLDGVVPTVYDHEPTGPVDRSASVIWTGMDADFFSLTVRLYVKVSDARAAQVALYELVQDTEAAMTSQFIVGDWTVEYDPTAQVLMAVMATRAGREDQ